MTRTVNVSASTKANLSLLRVIQSLLTVFKLLTVRSITNLTRRVLLLYELLTLMVKPLQTKNHLFQMMQNQLKNMTTH